jgi:hypothetical protein
MGVRGMKAIVPSTYGDDFKNLELLSRKICRGDGRLNLEDLVLLFKKFSGFEL